MVTIARSQYFLYLQYFYLHFSIHMCLMTLVSFVLNFSLSRFVKSTDTDDQKKKVCPNAWKIRVRMTFYCSSVHGCILWLVELLKATLNKTEAGNRHFSCPFQSSPRYAWKRDGKHAETRPHFRTFCHIIWKLLCYF